MAKHTSNANAVLSTLAGGSRKNMHFRVRYSKSAATKRAGSAMSKCND